MVRISRDRINTQRGKAQSMIKTLVRCCLAVLLSAAMPLLFVLRISVSMKQMSHHMDTAKVKKLSESDAQQQQSTPLQQHDLQNLPSPFTFLSELLPLTSADSSVPRYLGSDIVELDHCQLQQLSDWSHFMTWSRPIVNDTMQSFYSNAQIRKMALSTSDNNDFALMEQEIILELLEMYATRNGYCDFDKYRPTVPQTALHDEVGAALQTWNALPLTSSSSSSSPQQLMDEDDHDNHMPRFLVVIIAFRDVEQLERLIQAMMMPQHRFIIHLERRTPVEYVQQIQELCQKNSNNVFMIQFGTVVYRTDSVSLINLRIMRWAVDDLKLSYDYHVQVDGAVYPLWDAKELALYVQQQRPKTLAWIGELTHRGQAVRDVDQTSYLQRKRLVSTVATNVRVAELKLQKKLSRKVLIPKELQQPSSSTLNATETWDVTTLPSFVQKSMRYKTNSGNQAIYSYATVVRLLQSTQVMELFALAKYGCCCCIEERTWIAALALIDDGAFHDALAHTSMFQVWGGLTELTCGSSMNNAVLSSNASLCYRLEDVHLHNMEPKNETAGKRKKTNPVNLWGNETMAYLTRAKARGVWFARKFKSTDEQSMALLKAVQNHLHTPPS